METLFISWSDSAFFRGWLDPYSFVFHAFRILYTNRKCLLTSLYYCSVQNEKGVPGDDKEPVAGDDNSK